MESNNSQKYELSAEQFGVLNQVKAQSVRARLCRTGSYSALWSSHPNPLGAVPAPTIFFRRAHSMSPATDTLVRMTYPREPLR